MCIRDRDATNLSGPHAQLLTKHFNSITSGNDMKWSSTEPTAGTFTYTAADAQVSFAQTNHMLIRGHNLVWASGSQTPAWDVVNEPLDPNQPDCLSRGPFYKVLGKSYIDIALQAARQYAPAGTQLFI